MAPGSAGDARRRELQRRAFAPGGGLTDAEAAELQQLSRPHDQVELTRADEPGALRRPDGAAAAASLTSAESPTSAGSPASATVPTVPEPPAEAEDQAATDEAAPEKRAGLRLGIPVLRLLRLRFPALVLSAVVAVLIGVGVGWLAFGRDDSVPAMTDAQRATLVKLAASDEFDAGSIVLKGVKHGAEAWFATQDHAQSECLVLVAEDQQQTTCQKAGEENIFGLQANVSLQEEGETVAIWAVLMEDVRGERVTLIQRDVMSEDDSSWRVRFTGRDLEIAEYLDANDYPGDMLQLIGYDDTLPVWMTFTGAEFCMVIAEPTELIAEGCAPFDSADGSRLDVSTDRATYQLNLSESADPTLTVIRTPPSVVCDTDSGYCAVDDRTGEPSG